MKIEEIERQLETLKGLIEYQEVLSNVCEVTSVSYLNENRRRRTINDTGWYEDFGKEIEKAIENERKRVTDQISKFKESLNIDEDIS